MITIECVKHKLIIIDGVFLHLNQKNILIPTPTVNAEGSIIGAGVIKITTFIQDEIVITGWTVELL
jgi:hypothetical protein